MKTKTVYTVIYDVPEYGGGMTDRAEHFKTMASALAFSAGNTHWGKVAIVQVETNVPVHIAARWGV